MYPALDSSSQCLGSGQRPLGLLFTVHEKWCSEILTICVFVTTEVFLVVFSTIPSLGGLYGYRLPFSLFCTQPLYVTDRMHTKVISFYIQG